MMTVPGICLVDAARWHRPHQALQW